MNKTLMLDTANYIERSKDMDFGMDSPCSCIAAFAMKYIQRPLMDGKTIRPWREIMYIMMNEFELTPGQTAAIFDPRKLIFQINRENAVIFLRNVAGYSHQPNKTELMTLWKRIIAKNPPSDHLELWEQ